MRYNNGWIDSMKKKKTTTDKQKGKKQRWTNTWMCHVHLFKHFLAS